MTRGGTSPSGAGEELADDREEDVEAVVVQPVARPLDADDLRVAEGLGAAVLGRVPRAALRAVEQERRTADARPQELDVPAAHVVRRPRAHVVVELPAVGPVLVLVDAVGGEVPRLLGGEVRVLLLHTAEGVLDRRVAPRQPAGERALLADPLVHALGDRLGGARGELARRRAEPLDGDQLRDRLGVDAGVAERDVAAERVGDDRDGREPLLVDELRQVVDVARHRVATVRGPLAVAVAAEVGRDHVPVVAERLRRPVPVAAVVAPAVEQHERRLLAVAPVHVVKPQALGEVRARGRSRLAIGQDARSFSRWISRRRRILPDADFGIWSMNSRCRMRLCGATRCATNAMIASPVVARDAASDLRTTKAFGTSPASSSSLRTTAQSSTAGCVSSSASSSAGATCMPLYLISSFVRSTT